MANRAAYLATLSLDEYYERHVKPVNKWRKAALGPYPTRGQMSRHYHRTHFFGPAYPQQRQRLLNEQARMARLDAEIDSNLPRGRKKSSKAVETENAELEAERLAKLAKLEERRLKFARQDEEHKAKMICRQKAKEQKERKGKMLVKKSEDSQSVENASPLQEKKEKMLAKKSDDSQNVKERKEKILAKKSKDSEKVERALLVPPTSTKTYKKLTKLLDIVKLQKRHGPKSEMMKMKENQKKEEKSMLKQDKQQQVQDIPVEIMPDVDEPLVLRIGDEILYDEAYKDDPLWMQQVDVNCKLNQI